MTLRAWTALVLLGLFVLVSACGRRGSPFADGGDSSEIDVVGPSTLRVEGRLIRLAGVSVPQPAPRARCWAEALLAREAMEVLHAETDYVRDLEIEAAPNSQGRVKVLVHGRDLSRLLIDRGVAAQTGEGWDWCGPLDLTRPRAPRLGYTPAPVAPTSESQGAAQPVGAPTRESEP